MASIGNKHREIAIVAPVTSFFFKLGPQLMGRCHPHAERLLLPRLDLSRITLIDNTSWAIQNPARSFTGISHGLHPFTFLEVFAE